MKGILRYNNNQGFWLVDYEEYVQVYPRSGRDAQGCEKYDWVAKQLPLDLEDAKAFALNVHYFTKGIEFEVVGGVAKIICPEELPEESWSKVFDECRMQGRELNLYYLQEFYYPPTKIRK